MPGVAGSAADPGNLAHRCGFFASPIQLFAGITRLATRISGRSISKRRRVGWHPVCVASGMRFVFAFLLVAHGVAHLVGAISSWQLATLAGLPYKTTIFSGRLDVGDAGIQVVGVLWLIAALAFLVGAIAFITDRDWAGRFVFAAVAASMLLCAMGWPDSRLGLAVNVGLALVLAIGARSHSAVLTP
jgi:hypothetical protein